MTRIPVALALLAAVLAVTACGDCARSAPHLEHVVFVWLKEPGNPEHIAKLVEGSKRLTAIASVQSLEVGTCVKSERPIVDSSWDVGLVVRFADEAGMKAYLTDPRHVALVDGTLKPLSARVQVYDIATR
jgi:hypothetical protein